MRIAIIGAGISGLSAAWFLKNEHTVTVFEKQEHFGGHANTSTINYNGNEINVDTGFIVFNYQTYYHLQRLFKELKVDTCKSNMSFGVSNSTIEYSSVGPFANKKNLLNLKYLKMLFEIIRFNRISNKIELNTNESLEEYLNQFSFSQYFRKNYIYPMAGAIWSCTVEEAQNYPAKSFINFFKHHGLLQITHHPQWYSVVGGSKEYVRKIVEYPEITFHKTPVHKVQKHEDSIKVSHKKGEDIFDIAIVATHADEAFALTNETILSEFKYSKNLAILHKNPSLMPKNKKNWASWNYVSNSTNNLCLTYYMNNLQPIPESLPLFVTLNPNKEISKEDIFYQTTYHHPIFNHTAHNIQKNIKEIQGKNNIYYIGSYMNHGFHEDGIKSSYDICTTLVKKMPW
jgi:predicted NAD/FAD-binding protein